MSVSGDNDELRELFEADQAERSGLIPSPDQWEGIARRDTERRQRARSLIESGAVRTGADHFHTAMLFQHGDQLEDYWRAHELARRADELGDRRGRWLAAAAYDRWLVAQNKPQKYGTQYTQVNGEYVLSEVDPATTDDERAEWDVPPLSVALERASQFPKLADPLQAFLEDPPLRTLEAPGLRVEIKRWIGPPRPSDVPRPTPEALEAGVQLGIEDLLPVGVTLGRVAGGYGATDAAGELVLNWWIAPLKDGALVLPWFDDFGPPPELEAVTVGGQPAVWIGATPSVPATVLLALDNSRCRGVAGKLEREVLLQLAARLSTA